MKKTLRRAFYNAWVLFCITPMLFAQSENEKGDQFDRNEIDKYLSAKRENSIIFDSTNIKQFWIDKTVSAFDDGITILLDSLNNGSYRSIPQKIKFMNIDESMDCVIETGVDALDVNMEIYGENGKEIPQKKTETAFQQRKIISSTIHLDDLSFTNNTINLVFSSKTKDLISLKKIVISFHTNLNSSFIFNHGKMKIQLNDIIFSEGEISESENNLILLGKRCLAFTKDNIVAGDTPIKISAKIDNKGDNRAKIYIGYAIYSHEKKPLYPKNYPYSPDNEIIHIIEANNGSKSIIVDKYPKWEKGCFLAFNATDDLSDIPSFDISIGSIRDITKMDNGNAIITLSNELTSSYSPGTLARVHGMREGYLYKVKDFINPGESKTYETEIVKDDNYLLFSSQALSRNVYYVKPVIGFVSSDLEKDCKIEITDGIIDY